MNNPIKKTAARLLALLFVASNASFYACNSGGSSSTELTSLSDSMAYSIGISIGSNMKKDNLDSLNLDILKQAMAVALSGDTNLLISQFEAQGVIQKYLAEQQSKKSNDNLAKCKSFLDENGKKKGIITTASGLQYEVVKEGTGPKPTINDTVKTNYHGTLIDGTVFDSSVDRGEPVEFPVGAVIKGWTEALQLMSVGSKYRLYVPSDLAYGDRGQGPITPNSALIFDLELLEIKGKK
jgi:FKBP-type peptidyl-prolyl cis-trans isomerase FklB